MTHNHVEQHPAYRILADHTVSFARERQLTMIAKKSRYFQPGYLTDENFMFELKYLISRGFLVKSLAYKIDS